MNLMINWRRKKKNSRGRMERIL
ncbi:unnamed protein product [Spirodela intermedia]|uniref:Uncharacterized protein n=2 Tax=Spirodela intermedia TaxID=51605 RepID=A0A7I8JZP7_SPIIN|nr:unnamed protein product [Spirodela intermedia]CAA6654678.1 unnamed protein product [Spirodela intermedia]CAA7389328.1 unnamed protein product [Spirodela intermedia]